jgi:hypothetical protein
MEEGELDNDSSPSGEFSGADSNDEEEWSGDESASVIADRIQQQRSAHTNAETGIIKKLGKGNRTGTRIINGNRL